MRFEAATALITGASTGIGAAFATELAARGANLILVARNEPALQALATRLHAAHAVHVTVLPADLSLPSAGVAVAGRVAALGLDVDVLINNAGFATHGRVSDTDPGRLAAQVAVNTAAVVDLTAAFLPAMTARDRGAVINIASTVAFQPAPLLATYAAAKAFVLSFTEAVWQETRASGVRVLAVCPGVTDTPFFDVVGVDVPAASIHRRSPEQVVSTALQALDRRQPSVVDGRLNALAAALPRLLPRRAALVIAARVTRTASG